MRINSPGGDVYEGVAIFNALKANPAKITVRVEGMAASVASLIAMAADQVEMPSNAMFLIHEPRFDFAGGTAADLEKAAADLKVMTASFVAAYAEKTGGDPAAIAALMVEDRVMSAAEAMSLGFADVITDAVRMTASYSLTKLPKKARAVVEAALTEGKPKMTKAALKNGTSAAALLRGKAKGGKRPRAAGDKPTMDDLKQQMDSIAKAMADMTEDEGQEESENQDGAAVASDDDEESSTDTDNPSGSEGDEGDEGEGGEEEEDVAPPPAPKSKGKAKAIRTFRNGQEQALAYAQQVTETCALAGFPGKAATYIAERKPMAEIRSLLMKARGSRATPATAGQHAYGGARGTGSPAAEAEASRSWGRAVDKVNASVRRPGRKA